MDDGSASTEVCGHCHELGKRNQHLAIYVSQLRQRNRVLRRLHRHDGARIRKLQSTVARLEGELREARGEVPATARNSSLPPSANPPGAPKPVVKKPTGRHTGAQRGHKGRWRPLLPPEKVDQTIEHRPTACVHCEAALPESIAGTVEARHQQWELPQRLIRITEHRAMAVLCPNCGQVSRGEIPDSVPGHPSRTSRIAAHHNRRHAYIDTIALRI